MVVDESLMLEYNFEQCLEFREFMGLDLGIYIAVHALTEVLYYWGCSIHCGSCTVRVLEAKENELF